MTDQVSPPVKTRGGLPIAVAVIIGGALLVAALPRVGPPPSSTFKALQLGTPAPPFELVVTLNLEGLQITNETDATWDACRFTIANDYAANVPLLTPRGTVRIAFEEFQNGTRSIPRGEGYVRLKRGVEVSCSGPDYNRHVQRLTF